MILQGPFQLPSLWFCDHIRPLCLGSLTAAEHSLVLRGRSREQREPKPRPPAGSPRQQRRAEFRESRGPSLVSSSQRAPTLSTGLGSTLPASTWDLPHCVARLPESSWRLLSKVGHSGLQSQPLLTPPYFFWFVGSEHLSEPLSFGWASSLASLCYPGSAGVKIWWIPTPACTHTHMHTSASCSELLGEGWSCASVCSWLV